MAKGRGLGILVVTWNYPPKRGGMENLIAGLCGALTKNHRLYIMAPYSTTGAASANSVFRPKRPGLPPFCAHALIQGARLLWGHPDIQLIMGGSAMVTPLVLALARLFRRKAIVHVHGLDLIYPSILYRFLCVRWIKHCDRVIANSRFTASLARAKRVRENSLHVIPPGVDSERPLLTANEGKKALGLDGRRVLLYVGRLTGRKGVKEFIERVLPSIVAEEPGVCFVIVGDNASDSMVHRDDVVGEIRATLKAGPLQNHVRMLGSLGGADLAKAYAAADLLVLPVVPMEHDVEGFGIVVLEAAAAGRPCVATRAGGIPDAIEDGKSGILVEAGDYGSMSRAIARLLRDDGLREGMGRYAQKRAQEHFAWPVIASRYEEILSGLTAARP